MKIKDSIAHWELAGSKAHGASLYLVEEGL